MTPNSAQLTLMGELVKKLNDATKAYDEGHPIMSDKDWDDLYFQLDNLEKQYNYVLPNSPTHLIDYQVVSKLNKVVHNHPMLSLAKTKNIEEVKEFLGSKSFIAMCKMDGLTCSLRYVNGKLVSAETRGNGAEGEDVFHNAKVIPSIPKQISYNEELIVDGEIICKYDDFQPFSETYKNPRNFAAGSIRLLDSKECEKRNLTFVAWDVIKGFNHIDNLYDKLSQLKYEGFTVVPNIIGNVDICIDTIKRFAEDEKYPIDGVVFKFCDIEFSKSLGQTEHHFKNAIAYKFYDETYPTLLRNIEWTMGRTGILTPVAVFDSIDIDGSVVERASLHNISIMTELLGDHPWVGQKIEVYKANMIIPQVYSAEKENPYATDELIMPRVCPICGQSVEIAESDTGVKNLVCFNINCEGKLINRLDHFCGKKGLDIKGLSKATLGKLLDYGWINKLVDIFKLKQYRDEWIKIPGFGEKSVDNILNAIEESRHTTFQAFLSSLGIPLIGSTLAKDLAQKIPTYEQFRQMVDDHFDFCQYDGFALTKALQLYSFDYSQADEVVKYLIFSSPELATAKHTESKLNGQTVVITGKLQQFKNRQELKDIIEQNGGKTTDSVSKNTTILINNDVSSTTTKNLSAKKYGIPILSEEDFIQKFLR